MKRLFIILIFVPLISFSQEYSEVVEVPNKTSEKLYTSAKEWFALTFKSSNDVIQLDDPAEKKIIGKGVKQVEYLVRKIPLFMNVYFTLSVQFKDNRYKYDIQSNEIKSGVGKDYTYKELKLMATEEGLTEYYKRMGVKPWIVGKKNFQENLENNKSVVILIESNLHGIVDNLTSALKKEDKKDNW